MLSTPPKKDTSTHEKKIYLTNLKLVVICRWLCLTNHDFQGSLRVRSVTLIFDQDIVPWYSHDSAIDVGSITMSAMISYAFHLWFPPDQILVFIQRSFATSVRPVGLPPFQFPLPFWPEIPWKIQWKSMAISGKSWKIWPEISWFLWSPPKEIPWTVMENMGNLSHDFCKWSPPSAPGNLFNPFHQKKGCWHTWQCLCGSILPCIPSFLSHDVCLHWP